jgi:alkaline phosphatase
MLTHTPELHANYPDYLWYPGVLSNVSTSSERLAQVYFKHLQDSPGGDLTKWAKKTVADDLGIHDATDEEIALIVDHPEIAPYTFADMVSRRAQTGWSTHGHSG